LELKNAGFSEEKETEDPGKKYIKSQEFISCVDARTIQIKALDPAFIS